MPRRSDRLMMSGYYRSDKEDDPDRTISYHETPPGRIFNKRMGYKQSRSSYPRTSSSRSSLDSKELAALECSVTSCSDLQTSATSISSLSGDLPCMRNNRPQMATCFSSEHSSEKENKRCYSGGCLAGFAHYLMDVLLLSRSTRHLRKPVLTAIVLTFGLTLALGFWINPSVFMSVFTVCSHTKTTQAQPFTSTKNAETVRMEMLRDEIFSHVSQRENKREETWKRELDIALNEITLLKEERLKQEQTTEMMKTELSDLKSTMNSEDLDRSWFEQQIVEAEKQISELRAVLSSWLQQHVVLASGSQGALVHQAELQEALKDLEQRLMDHFSLEMAKERKDLWKSVKENMGALTRQDVDDTVQKALRLFRADGVGMADFALESLGSTVVLSRCSESHGTNSAYFSLFGITLFYLPVSPRSIIQPEVYPGNCWAFKGDQGFATIALAYPVYITHVTLEHLPKELSPTGHTYNAPKDFGVYGMGQSDEEEKLLGTFLYEYDREPIQTFELPEPVKDVFSVVQLRVRSNWGHPDYTCIYRFRVHGQLQTP